MKSNLIFAITFISVIICGCADKDYLITISTEYGDMKIILYDETPKHKAAFLEMAESGKYDSTIFHRVMNEFMIQGGDVNQKPGVKEPDNTLIAAEFRPNLVHAKGMLAGARQGENINPQKKSGTQFYIVHGRKYSRAEIDQLIESGYYNILMGRLNDLFQQGKYRDVLNEMLELQKTNNEGGLRQKVYECVPIVENEYGKIPKKKYTDSQYKTYEVMGGSPHLDWEYTVFGQIVDGIEVVDAIAAQPTGVADKPLNDLYMTISVERMARKKISSLYGYQYPE